VTKVCFISPEYLPLSGGTGAYVYYLSRELMKRGYQVSIVTGYDEARDVQVNEQLNVYFLKVFKAPVVKSFMFADRKSTRLNSSH
jgi:hypothetical protein